PAGVPGQWYAVDITGLYNSWQSGLYPNYGLQLRPQDNWNNYNAFYSADYTGDPTLRPKLVITAPAPVAPAISVPPQSQTVQAAANVVFSVTATGTPPLSYQWRKSGVNIAGATGATLSLTSVGASASGGYSVVVQNPAGSIVSGTAFLSVLADGANGNDPGQISASGLVTQMPGQNNLVIVTHGWSAFSLPVLDPWVTGLADAIRSSAPSGWQVVPIDWTLEAYTLLPDMALVNGRIKGMLLGEQIASQSWSHVHLIGKSAGAALIQAAADAIKHSTPSKEVHTTFLDPYLGLNYRGRSWYGMNADWSENYFAHDLWTDVPASLTEGPLDNTFNVNVTWADPSILLTPIYCQTAGSTPPTLGDEAWSSHDWPREFYYRTVLGTQPTCASGFGFSMSKEGGGWDSHGTHPIGQAPLVPCGLPPVTQNPFPMRFDFEFRFDQLPSATSGAGVSFLGNTSFLLNSSPSHLLLNGRQDGGREPEDGDPTGTPAWLAVGVTTSNAANFVQFDAGFTSTNGAQGLMTVYWNTNQIGTVDERIESPGLHSYRFALPGAVTNGLYTLSFRLDSFTNTTSSVTVTNVATGFAGVSQPLTLGMVRGTNGAPLLELTGAAGYTYLVQTSTNLVDWAPTALLVNTNGTIFFADPTATNYSRRFYQALMP
ncbi:MAG: DNRLRE domain-containing protein, partial [Verrucomicrobia bacterium]|nr:DNRLRE domain-containing protein [Verrucomicrobiota bacterium]